MASSYQDRLKARRGVKVTKQKPIKELKLNDKRTIRGKTVYWNPYTKSWSKTRVFKKQPKNQNAKLRKDVVNKEAEKKRKLIDNARKKGIAPSADLRGSATRNQPNTNQSNKDEKPTTESKAKTNELEDDNDLADRREEKNFRSSSSVEQAKDKADPLRKYRRGEGTGRKETRITKKLKKAGFTEDRLAKLRKRNAAFQKAKKGGKKAMEKYREKYPKRG